MPNLINRAERVSGLAAVIAFVAFGLLPAPAVAAPYPIPLFDLKLLQPVSAVSSLNSGSRFLAVAIDPDTEAPVRVLSIDKRGRVSSIDELAGVTEVTVPAERLWITGETEGQQAPANAASAPPAKRGVTSVQVYLSDGGEAYTVVYKASGGYYELRHKDKNGRLLFIATPKDGYGLKTVLSSYDGSRVLVVDESNLTEEGGGLFGQRLYFYNKDGRLTADHDTGDDLDTWLDTSGGFMACDGSYYAAVRGMGTRPGTSVVLFSGDGKLLWERSYFLTHRLTDDFGGTVGVKGGSPSLLSYFNPDGSLKAIERSGYGFNFWLSRDGAYAYVKVFKPFDVAKSGVPEQIKTVFPGAKVVSLDVNKLLPEDGCRPGLTIAPDGKAFIHYCFVSLGRQEASMLAYYDPPASEIWRERFYHGFVTPQFVDGSRGFLLKFGAPATRLIYYEVR